MAPADLDVGTLRPTRRSVRHLVSDTPWAVVVALAVLLVFFAHFRPWQGGLVEEWGLVQAWERVGFSAYLDRHMLGLTLARPLLLLPVYLVLEISRGSMVGLYAAAAILAVAQMLLIQWALVPTGARRGIRWALGLAVAMHPWWIAGFTLRFFSAQVAVTLCLLWFGAIVRYLHGGGRRWLVVASGALLAGCLTYPAPAPTVLFGLAALIVAMGVGRRIVVASGVTFATIGVYGVWSLIIAPRLASTYESQLIAQFDATPLQAVRAVVRSVALGAPGLLAVILLGAGVVLSLGFSRLLAPTRAWLALALVAATSGAALIFYPSTFHLTSADHVPLAVGLAAWFVLCGLAPLIDKSPPLSVVVQSVTVVAVVIAAVAGNVVWGGYAAGQQSMLDLAGEMRDEVPAGDRLVAADASGHYGSLYLLLPPYIDVALQVADGPGPETVLCTTTGVAKQAGVDTPDCSTLIESPGAAFLGEGETPYGEVAFYSVPVEAP